MPMITVFLIILVAVFATLFLLLEPSETDKRIQERLSTLDHRLAVDGEQTEIVRRVTFSRIPWIDRILRDTKSAPRLQSLLDQAKMRWTVGRFFFYSSCCMLVGAIIGNWWIPVGFVGWIPGLALGLAPFGWVLFRRSDRFRRFNLQLPDAVDLIARSLRAGHSLPSALVNVAEEVADPLGSEFRQCADEMAYGLPFREAMLNLFHRFPLQDLQFLIAAILVQKETGGNLAELLDKTAAVLRSRIQLQQKVKVYTAQGRLTGIILISMPFVSFVLLNIVKPGYTSPLFETETGRKMIYGTLASMTLGAIFIRRIIQIKY
ncbi:MAG: type II secretion system F family protein [Candidatus Korobacteraceae bacterium]